MTIGVSETLWWYKLKVKSQISVFSLRQRDYYIWSISVGRRILERPQGVYKTPFSLQKCYREFQDEGGDQRDWVRKTDRRRTGTNGE